MLPPGFQVLFAPTEDDEAGGWCLIDEADSPDRARRFPTEAEAIGYAWATWCTRMRLSAKATDERELLLRLADAMVEVLGNLFDDHEMEVRRLVIGYHAAQLRG